MKLIKKEKLNDTLTRNWTKFIDYKMLLDLAINTIKLYANNWVENKVGLQFKGNKLLITKYDIDESGHKFEIKFEILMNTKIAAGTIEIKSDFSGLCSIVNVDGNLYTIQHLPV